MKTEFYFAFYREHAIDVDMPLVTIKALPVSAWN